jgi:hypothetical protein
MRLRTSRLVACAAVSAAVMLVGRAQATVISQWSFSTTNTGPINTVSPSTDVTGTSTGFQLGMTNPYTYAGGEGPGSVAACDIVSTSGTATPSFTEDTWRIRGNSNTKNSGAGMANGWNNSAPNYTQGAQFDVSTAGYDDINLSFDWYSTTQGVANLQVMYTTDGTDFTPFGSDFIATPNDFYGGAANEPELTVNFTGVPGVDNNPLFAVQLVSVQPVPTDANYASTNGDGDYAAAAGGNYNNSSGNWRFDNITVAGTAVPEPASLGLLAMGAVGLAARRRTAKK